MYALQAGNEWGYAGLLYGAVPVVQIYKRLVHVHPGVLAVLALLSYLRCVWPCTFPGGRLGPTAPSHVH